MRLFMSAALACAVVSGTGSAGPVALPITATPANANFTSFGATEASTAAGTAARYVNLDPTDAHPLVSVATDKVRRAWCTEEQAEEGLCPKFLLEDQIPAGESADVPGTAALALGTYDFYCIKHPRMAGVLRVE
jgi:plastocyanin